MDLRYALRGLRRRPGFAAAVILTLGLGIGANATMFGIVDQLLFRPPKYLIEPDRVHRVYLGRTFEREGETFTSNVSYKRYLEFTEWAQSLDRTAAYFLPELAIGTGDNAREMRVGTVSASFFGFFDIRPALGRFFTPAEDQVPDGTPVAVLGHDFWQSQYGGRADVLGKTVHIGARVYEIIGVAPNGFVGLASTAPAAFVPITAFANEAFGAGIGFAPAANRPTYYGGHNMSWMEIIARRKPGVSAEAASADLSSAHRRSYLEQKSVNPNLRPIELTKPRVVAAPIQTQRGPNRAQDTRVATWLTGVAAVVLLIACANVANLLLARAFGRRREIAIRVALGVGRGRLLRQLVVESLVLAALGALAGLAISEWGGGILRAVLLGERDWANTFTDGRVLLFTAGATLAVGVFTGLAPAVHTGRGDIAAALKSGAREGTYHRSRLRIGLIVVQVALSVMLLVGAGLFVRSLQKVQTVDLGYDPDRVLYVHLQMRGIQLEPEAQAALRRQLVDRAKSLPFVEGASRTVGVPFWMSSIQDISVPGIDSVSRLGDFYYHAVSPGYFATMGTEIRRGRPINEGDAPNGQRVIVVSQSMAALLWPRQDPLGQCVKIGADTVPCSLVVGVAQDIRRESLTKEEGLQYYVPIEQSPRARGGLFVRTRGNAAARAEQLRRELQKEMPGISYVAITPLAEILAPNMRSWRLGATMFAVFGGLALLLAGIGLYSVIAYNVAQRGQELAVRSALGASPMSVIRLVLGEGLRLAIAGVVIGVGLALAAARWIGPLLFDVSPRSPLIYSGVVLTLLAIATLASFVPAWRATKVDPIEVLRTD